MQMRWWKFNQRRDLKGEEARQAYLDAFRWNDVMPGDMVQSCGTMAVHPKDMYNREADDTKVYVLKSAPVLVISRHDGVPGDPSSSPDDTTFVCLTRHGILVVVNNKKV